VTPLMKKRTFLFKWVLPYAIVLAVLAWQFREEIAGTRSDYLSAALVGAAVLSILFFVIRRRSSGEPDEILDGGTFIRVSCDGVTEDIAFSNVEAIETSKLLRLTRAGLLLREPSRFGKVILFYPFQETEPSGENAVVARLRRKINAQVS
jgi:hypothetical protein